MGESVRMPLSSLIPPAQRCRSLRLTLTGCKSLSEVCDGQVALLSAALTSWEHSQCLCLILSRGIVSGIEGCGTVQLSGRSW